ncbi:DUF5403 family protein [Salininema proteolyticum]|uniref:DUF5403 family protein n=1 Tax=Salininema proteolyticum TaxID=1607685 RepID=A0ABV8TUC1_9ACTN
MSEPELYKAIGGKKLEKYIAYLPGVGEAMDSHVFEAKARADAELVEHRFQGHARVFTKKAKLDRYLVLDDSRGLDAAMSIEFGRKESRDPETGEVLITEMEGLFILHKAMGLARPDKRRGKVDVDPDVVKEKWRRR